MNHDSVLFWNRVALDAVARDFSGGTEAPPEQGGPTRTSRALAIIHIAMHDAYFGVVNNTKRYLMGTPAPAGALTAPAIAGAAMGALNSLYPRQRASFATALAKDPALGRASNSGWDFGLGVARAVLESRENDKSGGTQNQGSNLYCSSCQYGRHRPDPVTAAAGSGALHPRWGDVTLFGTNAIVPLDPYPGASSPGDFLADAVYKAHHDQVRSAGGHPSQNTTTRTPDQTVAGVYWGYDGANQLGTPPRLYNQIVRVLAGKHMTSEEENARLFLLVNLAMADAGINAWYWKYVYDLWRPVVGIREADPSVGPCTTASSPIGNDCDPAWRPLGAPATNSAGPDFTPGFPAYPSGHATFGAAAFQVLRLFLRRKNGLAFGDRAPDAFDFSFVSDEHDGVNNGADGRPRARHERRFASIWRALIENSISRVYLGVHWRFDGFLEESDIASKLNKVGGVPLGLCIAEEVWQRFEGAKP